MASQDVELSPEELARIIDLGDCDEELQERLAEFLRTDPRLERQFEELEAMTAEAGAVDYWQGLTSHYELDLLLKAPDWEDPVDVLDPGGIGPRYKVNYRTLFAVAEARLARAEDPAPIRGVIERLQRAEKALVQHAVYSVYEELEYFSRRTAGEVLTRVRSEYLDK